MLALLHLGGTKLYLLGLGIESVEARNNLAHRIFKLRNLRSGKTLYKRLELLDALR
jgi:hypothetical protein